LNIQSKVFKGTIEITSEKLLLKKGDKVGASEANLLTILGILPFEYTLQITKIFDNGGVYDPEILDISEDILQTKFNQSLKRVLGLSLGIGYPNKLSVPHLVGSAFKDVASVAVSFDYPLKQIADLQALLSDPEALAKAQAAVAKPEATQGEQAPEKKEEEALKVEDDVAVDFDFFD
jgi:large subunit ribosomal protein LP0